MVIHEAGSLSYSTCVMQAHGPVMWLLILSKLKK